MHQTTITVNRRTASYLLAQIEQHSLATQAKAWETPDILSLDAWLLRNWESLSRPQRLLTTSQEQCLWQDIIEQDDDLALLDTRATAEQAFAAWKLAISAKLHNNVLANYPIADTQHFIRWAEQYEGICRERDYQPQSNLLRTLIHLIEDLALPDSIEFYGFEQFSALERELISALENANKTVKLASLETTPATAWQLAYPDIETEIQLAANWAREQYQLSTDSLAIVVPSLDTLRPKIERIFTDTLAPDWQFNHQADAYLPFNISGGQALSHFPIVHAALKLIGFAEKSLPHTLLEFALSTPFMGGSESELFSRASLCKKLLSLNQTRFSLKQLINLGGPPIWIHRLKKLAHYLEGYDQNISHYEHYQSVLQILGWPGERELSSAEYQVWRRWLNLLSELDASPTLSTTPLFSAFQRRVTHYSNQTAFQIQTHDTRIQILGLLEAAGIQFDQIRVIGMHNQAWPPKPSPNAFIPLSLQQQHDLPHCSADKELRYCRQIQNTLVHSCKRIIFSYPKHDGDDVFQASELITDYPTLSETNKTVCPSVIMQIVDSASIEYYSDEKAPSFSPLEPIRGGSWILSDQAACPFRAFAKHRLQAYSSDTPTAYQDPRERGDIVHQILQCIWDELKTQAKLSSLPEAELSSLIDKHTLAVLKEVYLPNQFLTLERNRLQGMLFDWLTLEKQRSPFSIDELEAEYEVTFNAMNFTIRVDRIDTLENGQQFLIDYKTGTSSIHDWFGERPNAPQLPFYSLTLPKDIRGISFAEINVNGLKFKGISPEFDSVPGVVSPEKSPAKLDWHSVVSQWNTTLGNVVEAFKSGHAEVDPKLGEQTCRYCDLQALCRVLD